MSTLRTEGLSKSWGAFQANPEWIAARNASEEDGQIVTDIASSILAPTSFSALK